MESNSTNTLLNTTTLVRLGLNRQPFIDKGPDRFFFEDPGYTTQLNVVISMLRSSDKVILVKGCKGVGKSTLLERLEYSKQEGLSFCRIQANHSQTIDNICRQCLKTLDLASPPPGSDVLEYFSKRISSRRRIEGKTVLIVDNTHELEPLVLDQLFSLRKIVSEDGIPAIALVMAGHTDLEQKLQTLPRISAHPGIIHHVILHPLSLEQTHNYLKQRLNRISNSADIEILSSDEVEMIFHRSKGVPERIHSETCLVLDKNPGKQKAAKKESSSSSVGRPILISLIMLAMAVIAVFIFVDVQTLFTSSGTRTPETPQASEKPEIQKSTLNTNADVQLDSLSEKPKILPKKSPATDPVKTQQELDKTARVQMDQETATTENAVKIIESDEKKVETRSTIKTPSVALSEGKVKVDTTPVAPKKPELVKPLTPTPSALEPSQAYPASGDKPETDKPTDSVAQPATVKTEKPAPVNVPDEKPVSLASATDKPTEKPAEKVEPAKVTEKLVEPVKTVPEKTEPARIEAKTEPRTETVEPAQNAPKVTPVSNEVDLAVRWALEQNDQNFTIQLIAAQKEREVQKFLNRHPNLKDTYVLTTYRGDKTWLVVVVGSYKNRALATAAVKELPQALQTPAPWIRRFGPLKQILKPVEK